MKFLSKFISFNKKKYSNSSKDWKNIQINGIKVTIQPNFKSNKFVEDNLEQLSNRIYSLSRKWKLVYGTFSLYANDMHKSYSSQRGTINIYFRLGDSDGNSPYETIPGEMPDDIKRELISDVRNKFKSYYIDIDEYKTRGYIVFDITISHTN